MSSYRRGPDGRCACIACEGADRRASRAAAQVHGNASRQQRLLADPSLAPHGKASTYTNWMCRCEPCAAAMAVKNAEAHQRRKDEAQR